MLMSHHVVNCFVKAKLRGKKLNTLKDIPSQCLTAPTIIAGRAAFLEFQPNLSHKSSLSSRRCQIKTLKPRICDNTAAKLTAQRSRVIVFRPHRTLWPFFPGQLLGEFFFAHLPPGYIDGNSESHAYDVTFRSLSEDKVHPEAGSPVVKALENQIDVRLFNSPYTQTMIFGDYYGLFCKYGRKADGGLVDFLQIWNWKSKDTLQVSSSLLIFHSTDDRLGLPQCLKTFDVDYGTTHFSFITNDRLLVANSRELMLFSLDDSVNAIRLVAKFSLPALRDPFVCHYITFNPIPLHASTHNQLIAVNMCMSAPTTAESPYFTFYIERNTLLELESTYTSRYGEASQGSLNLPWSAWGPKYTRFFENSHSSCTHRIFGFRSAELIGELFSRGGQLQSRSLRIRDFNPHRVADFKAGNQAKSHQRLVEGETLKSALFLEPLGSGLPYLETTTQEKFLANDMTMEANRITLLSLEAVSHYCILIVDMALIKTQGDLHNISQSIEMLDFE
jgi:hypothetical protein